MREIVVYGKFSRFILITPPLLRQDLESQIKRLRTFYVQEQITAQDDLGQLHLLKILNKELYSNLVRHDSKN